MSTLIIPHPEAVVAPVTVRGCQEPTLEEGQCQGCTSVTSVTTHHNHPITITWVLINHLSPAIKTPFKSMLLPVTLWPVYHSLPRNHTRPSVHLPVYDYLSELLCSSLYSFEGSWFPFSIDPAKYFSHQLTAKTYWSVPRFSPAILSSWSVLSVNKSSCFTHLLFSTLFMTKTVKAIITNKMLLTLVRRHYCHSQYIGTARLLVYFSEMVELPYL